MTRIAKTLECGGKRGATPLSVALTTFGSTPVLRLLVSKGAELEDRLTTDSKLARDP